MKTAFFHDSILSYDVKGKYYTSGSLNSKLFKKYSNYYGKLIVVTRHRKLDNSSVLNSHSTSSCKGVIFKCINKLSVISLFIGEDRRHISGVIKDVDFSIVRLPSIIGIAAVLEAKKQNKPYLIEMVACPWDSLWYYGKIKYRIAAPILYFMNRFIISNAKQVRYVSANFLQSRYPTKGLSCSCSDVQLQKYPPSILEERIACIRNRSVNSKKIIVGTVASLHVKYKGQRYVMKAMNKLAKEGYDIDYYLVGGGDKSQLEEYAEKYKLINKVHFVGSLPHKEVLNFMQNIDLYVQPSNAESHGRVILEAFSVACPVIGSSTGGIPELVDERFVFKRKNVRDLIVKIKDIVDGNLEDQALRNHSESAKYNQDILDERMLSFYSKAISRELKDSNS